MPVIIHNHIVDKLALLVGVTSGIALYPQVWMIIHANSLEYFSIWTFCVMFLNSLVWLAYAIHRGLISVGISAILNMLASGTIVFKLATTIV